MEIEFDLAKDRINREKHGVGLDSAAVLLADPALEWVDRRQDWGETRHIAVGLYAGKLFACVYTMRGNVARIISVRRARHEERRRFQQAQEVRSRANQGDS